MIFNSNGGFTWNDVYYMPVKLREFYWRELLSYKDAEKEAYESMANSGKTQIGSGRISRR
jgi:hypothetical protein